MKTRKSEVARDVKSTHIGSDLSLADLLKRVSPRHLDIAAGKSGLTYLERRELVRIIGQMTK